MRRAAAMQGMASAAARDETVRPPLSLLLQWGQWRASEAKERESMSDGMVCPSCKASDLDVCSYRAMMVVRSDLALFTLTCPHCGAAVSSVQRIPERLRDEVNLVALEVGAGMGLE